MSETSDGDCILLKKQHLHTLRGKKTLDFSSYSPCGSNNNDELGTSQFMVGRLFGQNFASFS